MSIFMGNRPEDILQEQGLETFKLLCYQSSRAYEYACILDSCQLDTGVYKGKYEFLMALGAERIINQYDKDQIESLNGEWCFGVFSYDLKNKLEKLESVNPLLIVQEELALFIPQIVIAIDKQGQFQALKGKLELSQEPFKQGETKQLSKLNKIEQKDYVDRIHQIKELIKEDNWKFSSKK